MHLLFIIDDYLPHSSKVAAMMMHDLAVEFVKNGHEVTVLTPNNKQKQMLKKSFVDGVHVIYFKNYKIKNIGKYKRTLNETFLSYRAFKALKTDKKNIKYDGIISYSPSIFWGMLIKVLKRKWKCKSYLILRDIFPQWVVDNGLIKKNSLAHLYFTFIEKINYNAANHIGVMLPSNLEHFKERKYDLSKFEVLYNWSNLKIETKEITNFRSKYKLDNKIVLFYGGNIGYAQKIINLVNLAKKFLNNPSVHFLFVGAGDEVNIIIEEKRKYNLHNITYIPPVNQTTYFNMLNEFDIGLFTLHPDHKTDNFPGKLLGYMQYSKPILGCVNAGNDIKEIINAHEAGIVVNSNDELELYESAVKLTESQGLRKKMGDNGNRLLSTKFSVNDAYNQLYKFFV